MNNDNTLNNIKQSNMKTKQPNMSEQIEPIPTEKLQYEYLKELNKKLTLFKKNDQSEKNEEETGQTMRR